MDPLMIALEVDSGTVRLTCMPCVDRYAARWTVWTAPLSRPGAVAEIVRRAAQHGAEWHGIGAKKAENSATLVE